MPCPIMESLKHNFIYVRTSHTTAHLPFLSLAHHNGFFGFQSICLVPAAPGRGPESGCAIEQKPGAFCGRARASGSCPPPVPASSSPIDPLALMSGGGESGVGGQPGEGLNAVAAGRREGDSHTATLLPQSKCCLSPSLGPPLRWRGAEGKSLLQASSTNHLSTDPSPS